MENKQETPFSVALANAKPWPEYLATSAGKQYIAEKYAYCRAAAELLGGTVAQFAAQGAIYPVEKLEAGINSAVVEKFSTISGNVELERFRFDIQCADAEKNWQTKIPHCKPFPIHFAKWIQSLVLTEVVSELEEFCRFEAIKETADFRYLITCLLESSSNSHIPQIEEALFWLQAEERKALQSKGEPLSSITLKHEQELNSLQKNSASSNSPAKQEASDADVLPSKLSLRQIALIYFFDKSKPSIKPGSHATDIAQRYGWKSGAALYTKWLAHRRLNDIIGIVNKQAPSYIEDIEAIIPHLAEEYKKDAERVLHTLQQRVI